MNNSEDVKGVEKTEGPKNKGRIVFLVDNIVLIIFGAGMLGVSLFFLIFFKSFSVIFFATGFVGLACVTGSILSFFGFRYGRKEKEASLKYLIIHFAVLFMLALLIVLFAGLCFFFADFGSTIVLVNWNSYKKLVDIPSNSTEAEAETKINDRIEKYLLNYYVVGGIGGLLFLVVVVGLILGAYLMGILKLIKYILFVGAFSIIIIGLLCLIVGVYFICAFHYVRGIALGLTLAVIIMGVVMALLGAFGAYVGLDYTKHRFSLLLYLVMLLLYLIAFVCLGGVFFVSGFSTHDKIAVSVNSFCGVKENGKFLEGSCTDVQENIFSVYHCREEESTGGVRRIRIRTLGATSADVLKDVCTHSAEDISLALGLIAVFVEEYYKIMGYACFVFGMFLLTNIILVFVCIINPFGDAEEEVVVNDDDYYYGKRIEEREHKNDITSFLPSFLKKAKAVTPMDDY